MNKVDFEALGFNNNTCIHCETISEAQQVVEIMINSDIIFDHEEDEWVDYWKHSDETIVYYPTGPHYAEYSYAREDNDTIYSFEEFFELIKPVDIDGILNNLDNILEKEQTLITNQ